MQPFKISWDYPFKPNNHDLGMAVREIRNGTHQTTFDNNILQFTAHFNVHLFINSHFINKIINKKYAILSIFLLSSSFSTFSGVFSILSLIFLHLSPAEVFVKGECLFRALLFLNVLFSLSTFSFRFRVFFLFFPPPWFCETFLFFSKQCYEVIQTNACRKYFLIYHEKIHAAPSNFHRGDSGLNV